MNRLLSLTVPLAFIGLAGLAHADFPATDAVALADLRCEYLVNPLGLDVAKPRLSGIFTSSQRGEKQTAYQVLVASTQELLEKDQGDLWDSGKWKLEGGGFSLDVIILPNTTTIVELPTTNSASIEESGQAVAVYPEIKSTPSDNGTTHYEIGSGEYHFTCPMK